MDEGIFRVLRALGHGRSVARSALVRDAGEAHSVVAALEKGKAKWFLETGERLRLSPLGLAALARESHGRSAPEASDALQERFVALLDGRPGPRRELDQVHADPSSALARARRLLEDGDAQRGLLFLGDDDGIAVALALLLAEAGIERRIDVLDVDEALLAWAATAVGDEARLRTHLHDLREPLPKALRGRYGCVVTDPPYAPEGFALFLDRALEASKPDARLHLSFGGSRRAPDRVLAKQRLVAEAGWLLEAAEPGATRYDGAESIGASSDLWQLRRTPETRALKRSAEGALYTRRSPEE
ncbi:MAG: bis-aminopropyl spermidine synthase family protein [Myxococcota bacterium]